MQRSSLIATVFAAGGVLVAGSVASVAVINAAATGLPESQTLALVSDDSRSPAPSTPEPSTTPTPSALPAVESSELPALEPAGDQPSASKPASSVKSSTQRQTNTGATTKAAATVSAAQARTTVMKKGTGIAVLATSKQTHEGYPVWAVRIARSNGQVITGFVHRTSGTVIDWEVNRKAQSTPTPSPSASDDDFDDNGGSSDDDGALGHHFGGDDSDDRNSDDRDNSGSGRFGNDDSNNDDRNGGGNFGSGNSGSDNSGSGHSGGGDHDHDDD